jgi:hypothetical protein
VTGSPAINGNADGAAAGAISASLSPVVGAGFGAGFGDGFFVVVPLFPFDLFMQQYPMSPRRQHNKMSPRRRGKSQLDEAPSSLVSSLALTAGTVVGTSVGGPVGGFVVITTVVSAFGAKAAAIPPIAANPAIPAPAPRSPFASGDNPAGVVV